jgi:putative tricarboxylic transport membrane protein
MEKNLRRAMALSGGEWGVLFDSPIAITLWLMAAASLLAPLALRRFTKDLPVDLDSAVAEGVEDE